LRESYPKVPSWNDIHGAARKKMAELIRDVCAEKHITSPAELAQALHDDHGFPLYNAFRFDVLRREYPDIVPSFRKSQLDDLVSDADALVAAVKKDPTKPL